MAVITFSRQVGSRGSYIAAQVAQALGWRYYDREILHRAAAAIGLTGEADIEWLAHLEEPRGALRRLLETLGLQPAIPTVPSASLRELEAASSEIEALMKHEGLSLSEARQRALGSRYTLPVNEVVYRDLITRVITELAQAGHAVIMGRGSQVILSPFPGALRVQVVAHYLVRVERIMEREGLDRDAAKLRITAADQARAGFMQRYFGVDWLDPTLYDVVFNNSGRISESVIIDSIVAMARRL